MASRNTRETGAATPESAAPEMVQRISVRLWMQETHGSEPWDFWRQPEDIQTYWRDGARIAIEAMRDPTEAMLAAAPPTHSFDAFGRRFELLHSGAASTWTAMIDAALSAPTASPADRQGQVPGTPEKP